MLDTLPTEIITHVFLSAPDIASALALSATCRRCYSAYHSSRKLVILQEAADAEFGPIDDIIQLLTWNASQPAHIRRSVPMSEALLRQVVKVGRVAQRYEEIYPFKKWKTEWAYRRSLTNDERFILRRAIYRLWLFDKAFHNTSHVRTCRGIPDIVRERAALLHNWNTSELAQILDIHQVLRDIVANNVCPSNGKVRQKFQKRYSESKGPLLFNIHLNYPPACAPDSYYHNSPSAPSRYQSRLAPSRWHEPGAEGWGDDINHYYVVEDMMKLDPEQLLYLRDNCPLKSQVEMHVRGLGDWFVNNGETFSETLGFVIRQRGGDVEELKAAVEDCDVGIAVVMDN
ncbi:uncharacterized protein MYCFIDRAFT_211476 [Pseudocercospora fijiensis CIRAD86]|uniref:F-box domain-containing protein n=1 Tax=Pseudocercospora fijiensis (strain CIRAD86) TaxID=383855 RepID=M3AXL9_PSEFD|nr:uncharacterized protein MYCFIDRAFT_211476 [Pseudocercospora fijiensis CIRAD86]EME81848.1 hypothetical protein MYCFIDRAFT_211476 [Pseudocercospora fijiensis CIRAD86]